LYIADSTAVDEVNTHGTFSTLAGEDGDNYVGLNPTVGFSGVATDAFVEPSGVAVSNGDVYITEANFGCDVRELVPGVDISTVAESTTANQAGQTEANCDFGGDGSYAAVASLDYPQGIAVDGAGNLYVADSGDNRIREIGAPAQTTYLPVSGTVYYDTNGTTTPLAGAVVQACSTTTLACSAGGTTTDTNSNYTVLVPGADNHVVSAYPSPLGEVALSPGSTSPVAVGAGGVSGADITLTGVTALPSAASIAGQSGTVPVVYWGSPAPFDVTGCPNGLGMVLVTGADESTDEQFLNFVNLTESPPGSGNYEATIPPLEPGHGFMNVEYLIDCTPDSALNPASGPPRGARWSTSRGPGLPGPRRLTLAPLRPPISPSCLIPK
jgi:NHL repeat